MGLLKYRIHKFPVYPDYLCAGDPEAGVRYKVQDSLRSLDHFRYREKSAPTSNRGDEEYIFLKEKQFPAGNCLSVSLHKIP